MTIPEERDADGKVIGAPAPPPAWVLRGPCVLRHGEHGLWLGRYRAASGLVAAARDAAADLTVFAGPVYYEKAEPAKDLVRPARSLGCIL